MTLQSTSRNSGSSAPEPEQSDARRAAEAFFDPPATPPKPSMEAVIIRQKKTMKSDRSVETRSAPDVLPAAANRAPRIYRVASGVSEVLTQIRMEEAGGAPVDQHSVAPAATGTPSRRRRRLNGKVTIIRAQDDGASSAPAPDLDNFSSQGAATEPLLSTDTSLAWLTYPKLVERIKSLQTEARHAKQRETFEAIRWIKGAIAMYGLSAGDLGFR